MNGIVHAVLSTISVVLYLCFFVMGFGPTPNILYSEIFPTRALQVLDLVFKSSDLASGSLSVAVKLRFYASKWWCRPATEVVIVSLRGVSSYYSQCLVSSRGLLCLGGVSWVEICSC
ncbi:hypothetical protein DY000_02024029 [Brassica cretica]|uniref:Uncharacterized protein n=1 Tax=Brassica cretica TaxID=69181 RepID=A0ABQ7EJU7_BRACR|nr:hypothetical protein DY000_02024029 [Brassica cretica]